MARSAGKNAAAERPDKVEQAERSVQEAQLAAVRAFAVDPRFAGAREVMRELRARPPQSLLIEGGGIAERVAAALYWATLLNCRQPGPGGAPCLICPLCFTMASLGHRDLLFFDGRSETIKIQEVRDLRPVFSEPPREASRRVVIFCEMQASNEAVPNALLKALEEPKPATSFVLLAPQRERLLPTLVSRSWVLTLPWPQAGAAPQDEAAAEREERLRTVAEAMFVFAQHGRGWMAVSGRRGSIDAPLAMQLILLCQRALCAALTGNPPAEATPFSLALASLSPARQRFFDEALAEAQDSLNYTVNPTLVLDWLATRLFFLFTKGGQSD